MITYGAVQSLTFDVSSLATSSTFLVGVESNEIDNTTTRWDDIEISCDGILCNATTGSVIGQQIQLYLWGSDVSLATTPIDTLDGVASAETLTHDAVRQALRWVASPAATAVTAGLKYPILPFCVASQFYGNVPAFCGLYLAHNHAAALAAAQSAIWSWRGIKYTAT